MQTLDVQDKYLKDKPHHSNRSNSHRRGRTFSLSVQEQKAKVVDRWVSSTPPELVPPIYKLNQEVKRDTCVGGKLKKSNQNKIATIQGNENALLALTLNVKITHGLVPVQGLNKALIERKLGSLQLPLSLLCTF
jgi:hypothetical protein